MNQVGASKITDHAASVMENGLQKNEGPLHMLETAILEALLIGRR